jgi:hypothetical protein
MQCTPTYSSWINQVERWFAELTHQLIERGNHRNVKAWKKTSAPGSPTGMTTQNRSLDENRSTDYPVHLATNGR